MPNTRSNNGFSAIGSTESWDHEGAEVMRDFYAQMTEEDDFARSELMADRTAMINKIKNYYSANSEEIHWHPVEITSVEDADIHTSIKSCCTKFTVTVSCSDHKLRKLHYTEIHYVGNQMEPPSHDCDCVEIV